MFRAQKRRQRRYSETPRRDFSLSQQGLREPPLPARDRQAEETKDHILTVAEQLIATSQSVTARKITEAAGVADGLIVHHFGSYAGLVAELTRRLNERYKSQLEQFAPPAGISQLEIALLFFRELAKLDLHPRNKRLRRMSCRMSWDWKPADEQNLAGSIAMLLQPLSKRLVMKNTISPDDALITLWAIYLLPLRLALIDALLSPSVVHSEEKLINAIIDDLRPKFALVLSSNA
jgi:AcrR family transcriptional regulator